MRLRKPTNVPALFSVLGPLASKGGSLNFTQDDIEGLQAGFAGTLTLQTDPDYHQARQLFVPTFQHYPQIIAYCRVESDVLKAINFARKTKLNPVCRSGGHSTAGFSANDQMIIDLSNLSYVLIDKASKTMRVGGGTTFASINPMLDAYGLNMTTGGCETVSVGGYMQGGGYGFTALTNGMNCDCVREVRVALANGTVVNASETENRNLFWAVRGGTGNNFGVIVEITYNLREIGPMWGFGYHWPLDTPDGIMRAEKALQIWYDRMTGSKVPKGLGHQIAMTFYDDKPNMYLRGMYEGPPIDLEPLLADIVSTLKDPTGQRDYWQAGSYAQLNNDLLSVPVELPSVPPGIRSITSSRIMGDGLGAMEFKTIIDTLLRAPVNVNMFVLEPYGGQINAKKPGDTAFVHRNDRFDLGVYSFWLAEHDERAALDYVALFEQTMTPFSSGRAYQNYPNRRSTDFADLYFGENLERLRKVKTDVDKDNLFRFEQSIRPLDQP
jgi:FAD/FMN-containing dehydrogenase